MKWKTWLGLLLLAGSYGQLLFPRRMFTDPDLFFHGYPIVPGNLLAIAATLSALGIILVSEGVCEGLGAPSLMDLVTSGGRARLSRIFVAALAAGLTMELLAQWLGKLWFYPYWTPWFYWLVVVPGFVFYWIAIIESYVAVKAVLDFVATSRRAKGKHLGRLTGSFLGIVGAVLLIAAVWRYAAWYQAHGGYVFAATEPVHGTPPFLLVLLAFLGAFLVAEWGLQRQGLPSLVSSIRRAYWVPTAAVAVSSVLVSLVIESQNAVNRYWAYTHFPKPSIAFLGVPLSVFATWPLQYVAFLLVPSLFVPVLANLFWARTAIGFHPAT